MWNWFWTIVFFFYLSKNSINKIDTFKEMSHKNYNSIQFQNLKKDQTVL